MINKIMTADEAVAGVKDGMTIMVGGFWQQVHRKFLWMRL